MAQAPAAFIPTDSYYSNLPQGMTKAATPQGGTAYKDASGNMYLPTQGGLELAPTTLPGNNYQPPQPGQGLSPVPNAAPSAPVTVQPAPSPAPIGSGTPSPAATSSTSTATPPALDANGQPIQPQKTAAQIQAETDALATQPLASDTGTRTSSTLQDNFDAAIAAIGPAPTAPDSTTTEANANAQTGGVNDIQSSIDTLNTQLNNAQALAIQNVGNIKTAGIAAVVINGELKQVNAEDAFTIKTIQGQISDAKAQLTQAQTAVKTFMANQQTDYKNAEAQYQFEYTKALTQYNDELSQQDKAQANAKAAAQVVINSFKGTNPQAALASMDDTTLAGYATMDIQAGFPAGTIEAAIQNELNVTKFVKGADGAEYAYGFDSNGNPTVTKIGSVGGVKPPAASTTVSTGAWTKTQLSDNTNKMSSALQSAAGTDGFVSNGTYQQAKSDWIAAGGTAQSFETAFSKYKSTNASAGNS